MCKNQWVSWIVPIIKSGVTIMLGTWKEQGTVLQGRPHLTPFHPSFSPSLLPSPTDSQWEKLWGPSSSNLDAPSLIYLCSHSSKGDMVGPNRPADHTALGRTTAPNSFRRGLLRGEVLVSQRINENSSHRSATLNCQAKDFLPTSLPAEESFQLSRAFHSSRPETLQELVYEDLRISAKLW